MKRIGIVFFTFILSTISVFGQDYLLKIDNQEVTREEFERIYLKNRTEDIKTEKDIDEYVNLFVNFKLKVFEAKKLKYDTSTVFKTEYNQYITQLAEPYFINKKYEDDLIKQAYERSKTEVRVSYIFIKAASSNDTLAAYKKAMKIYKRLLNGEDFRKVTLETSEASSVKQNNGDAWFATVYGMPYAIENFAFDNKIGDFSKPILVGTGYYIIKITDKRNALGQVRASHIYVRLQENPSKSDSLQAMSKIKKIGDELKAGKNFGDVAKEFSEDKFSAPKGGDLDWFSTGKMLKPFESAVFGIKKVGQYVGPVRTKVGYHYIMLTDKKLIGSYDDEYETQKKLISQKPRYSIINKKVMQDIKNKYNFKQVSSLDDFYKNVDTSIFKGEWSDEKIKNANKALVTFADQTLSQKDFALFLVENQRKTRKQNINAYVDKKFEAFVNQTVKAYEISQMELNNREFKFIAKEYYEGLLLFDITNDKVWDKAMDDTVGLKKLYKQNRNAYSQKVDFVVYSCINEKAVKKTLKVLKKREKYNLSDSAVLDKVNKKLKVVSIEQSGIYSKGDNPTVDIAIDMIKDGKVADNENAFVIENTKKVVYRKDNFQQVKGLVTSDYQTVLENNWMAELRKNHKIEINNNVLADIKKSILK